MFKRMMGFRQYLGSDDPCVRKGVLNWLDRVLGFYGKDGGVDVEVISGQLLLNRRTAPYIYSRFTPLRLKYRKGFRPTLEKVVRAVTRTGMSNMAKMLAIMRRCRDNRDNVSPCIRFTGGSEEDILKSGSIMCNEIHRLFVCLCQVAGLPARLVCSHISGHMMSEVHVDGHWMWVDCMQGNYCFNDNGTPASAWDLLRDPAIIDRQDRKIWKDCRPAGLTDQPALLERDRALCQARIRDCYFNPREAVAIGNYYAWERDKYTFPWHTEAKNPAKLAAARIAESRHRRKYGWPDHYFDRNLFDDQLRMK